MAWGMIQDTIAAISTALGEAALSVLRISGAQALEVGGRVFSGRVALTEMRARVAYRASARGADGVVVDDGLLLVFRGKGSYTGEEVVEFHGHGGLLVTQKVYESVLAAGARADAAANAAE